MNKKTIGIGVAIIGIVIIGIGIGLKQNDPEMDNSTLTVIGLVLNILGVFLLFSANKEE